MSRSIVSLMLAVLLLEIGSGLQAERALFAAHPPLSHGTQAVIEMQPTVEDGQGHATDWA